MNGRAWMSLVLVVLTLGVVSCKDNFAVRPAIPRLNVDTTIVCNAWYRTYSTDPMMTDPLTLIAISIQQRDVDAGIRKVVDRYQDDDGHGDAPKLRDEVLDRCEAIGWRRYE